MTKNTMTNRPLLVTDSNVLEDIEFALELAEAAFKRRERLLSLLLAQGALNVIDMFGHNANKDLLILDDLMLTHDFEVRLAWKV